METQSQIDTQLILERQNLTDNSENVSKQIYFLIVYDLGI